MYDEKKTNWTELIAFVLLLQIDEEFQWNKKNANAKKNEYEKKRILTSIKSISKTTED